MTNSVIVARVPLPPSRLLLHTSSSPSSSIFLFTFLLLLLSLPSSSNALPQRRPVRITPFLYSDALNLGTDGVAEVLVASTRIEQNKNPAVDLARSEDGWGGQKMVQITPFLYSSMKRN